MVIYKNNNMKKNKLSLKEYQQLARRTCVSLGDYKLDLCHMVLGISSEEDELMRAFDVEDNVNALEECGDKAYYLANYCTMRGYNLETVFDEAKTHVYDTFENETNGMFVSNAFADIIKKHIAYGKEIDRTEEFEMLVKIAKSVLLVVEELDSDLERDLYKNIEKLKVRFPDSFSTEKALNRDLKAERKILES